MKRLPYYFLSVISGVLCSFGLPLVIPYISETPINDSIFFSLFPVAGICLLYALTKNKNPKEVFWSAFVASISYYMVVLYWINIAIVVFGHVNIALSLFAYLLLCLYCTLFWSSSFWLWRKIEINLPLSGNLVIAFVFVGLEFLRNYLFTGFPWGQIGYSGYRTFYIRVVASMGGVYLITFIYILFSTSIIDILTKKHKKFAFLGAGLSISIVILSIFMWNILPEKNVTNLKVAILQGNVEQGIKNKWRLYSNQILKRYLRLLDEASSKEVDLAVWPEASVPQQIPLYTKRLSLLADRVDWQVLGVIGTEKRDKIYRIYNSSISINRDGEITGWYHKSHLVPFGEYVPLRWLLPVNKIVPGMMDMTPGRDIHPIKIGNIRSGILICYEGIFPEISRQFTKRGADLMINITNDAWYGISSAPYQHLAFYQFRAVENGLSIIRAANTGVSAYIDEKGNILKRSKIFSTLILVNDDFKIRKKVTLYTYLGDWIGEYGLILTIFAIGANFWKRSSKSSQNRHQT